MNPYCDISVTTYFSTKEIILNSKFKFYNLAFSVRLLNYFGAFETKDPFKRNIFLQQIPP